MFLNVHQSVNCQSFRRLSPYFENRTSHYPHDNETTHINYNKVIMIVESARKPHNIQSGPFHLMCFNRYP
jgi:hypothetical protein